MTFSRADFQSLKWSLLAFLLALGLGGTLIMTSASFISRATADQHAAQRKLDETRRLMATAQEDRENMKIYAREYDALLKRNVVGNSQRLDWIEGLDKTHRQSRMIDFKYTISPQLPYTPIPAVDSGNFDINLSSMTMQFELLHEGQLFQFFDALRSNVKGWFLLDRCTVERNIAQGDDGLPAEESQLKAECTGGWLTLKNRSGK